MSHYVCLENLKFLNSIIDAFPSPPSLAYKSIEIKEEFIDKPVFDDQKHLTDSICTQLFTGSAENESIVDDSPVVEEGSTRIETDFTRMIGQELTGGLKPANQPMFDEQISVQETGPPVSIMPSLVPGSIIDMVNVPVENEGSSQKKAELIKPVVAEIPQDTPVAEVQSENEMDDTITGAQSFHLDFSIDESKLSISEPILEKSKVILL